MYVAVMETCSIENIMKQSPFNGFGAWQNLTEINDFNKEPIKTMFMQNISSALLVHNGFHMIQR